MNEKEKMLSGKLYNADIDKNLFNDRLKCKTLCQKYNSIPIENIDERKSLIKKNFWKNR